MASSTQEVVSDGTLVVLDLSIQYLDRSEISVFYDSIPAPSESWEWVGTTEHRIAFTPAVPVDVVVLVRRTTIITKLRHEFSNGAAFTATTLDEDLTQVLHIAQEASEAGASDMGASDLEAALVGSDGSALVGFIQSGEGAVVRTTQSKLRDTVSVKDFGAVGDGSTNDSAAITTAIAALNAGTIKTLYFPAGNYVVDTTFTITRNGSSLIGDGARTSILVQTSNVDTLIFTSTTPTSSDPNIGRIADVGMCDMSIDYGDMGAETSGRALTLIRVASSRFHNFAINSVYNGLDIIGGGGDVFFSNFTISSAYSWSSVSAGSWLMRFTKYADSINEVPSEFFFNNFNVKGSGTPNYLQHAILIQAGDGLFFSNGHCGLTDRYDVYINPQNDATATITDIKFNNVYMDGNFGGSTSGGGLGIAGSETATLSQISFIGCVFKMHKGHGINCALGVAGLIITGCTVSYNGAYGVILRATNTRFLDGLIVNGNYIAFNNQNNSSSDAITCTYNSGGIISGNTIRGAAAKPHPNGINIGTGCVAMNVVENITNNCTVDYPAPSTVNQITLQRNRKSANDPTIVSADGMVVPYGFDVVIVTGNTNFSNIGGVILPNRVVTLRFTGTPTITDNAGNINLTSNFTATVGSTLTLMCTSTAWVEVSRAIV